MRNIRRKLLLATIGIIGFGGHSTFAADKVMLLPGQPDVGTSTHPQTAHASTESARASVIPMTPTVATCSIRAVSSPVAATGGSGTTNPISRTDAATQTHDAAGAASLTVAPTGGSGTDTAIPVEEDTRTVNQRFSDLFSSLDATPTTPGTRAANLSATFNALDQTEIHYRTGSIQATIYNYLDRTIIHSSSSTLRGFIFSPEQIPPLLGLISTIVFVKYATDQGYLDSNNQFNIMVFGVMVFASSVAYIAKYGLPDWLTCSSCCRSTQKKLSRKWKAKLSDSEFFDDIVKLFAYAFAHKGMYVPARIESTLERLLLEQDTWRQVGEALFPPA